MTLERKGILIKGIINALNDEVKRKNEKLCNQNLHSEQTPLHGGDMFFKLAFMNDDAISEIAKKCGL